ncbi:MAG: TylF/MycF/NovP-related O-methyltransferase [Flavobacteriaceae bacterium]|nr:TylF/MycF/NovP-related O-methyltransferase [Flavobacteriaceae bacterium]
MGNLKSEWTPIVKEKYISKVVRRLIEKMDFEKFQKIILFGFSDNMKWIYRIMKENNKDLILCDWREKFIAYDCGGKQLLSILEIKNSSKYQVIVCLEDINEIKDSVRFIIENDLQKLNYVFDNQVPNFPFNYENPYNLIAQKAKQRAKSMISDEQLFDLIQFIDQTSSVEGDVVEFGSLHGGSGAIISEAVDCFSPGKNVYLFDTFKGIPKSKYGLDFHWINSFANNSFSEVKNAFKDMKNVNVIAGDINITYKKIKNNLSFAYIASDTYESGLLLLNYLWPKLNRGGILAVCDYGSFPNCYPLTVIVDLFFEDKKEEIFVYKPAKLGIFILKK